ncbi:MAG: hypothetical protein BWY79_01862 [Actinobacteria bacterium ADurb.Bin444]|nr:MAG: hypothetical protein BWY79_01862 [Actinobacteria bacterium ADurb.Bin444]
MRLDFGVGGVEVEHRHRTLPVLGDELITAGGCVGLYICQIRDGLRGQSSESLGLQGLILLTPHVQCVAVEDDDQIAAAEGQLVFDEGCGSVGRGIGVRETPAL